MSVECSRRHIFILSMWHIADLFSRKEPIVAQLTRPENLSPYNNMLIFLLYGFSGALTNCTINKQDCSSCGEKTPLKFRNITEK